MMDHLMDIAMQQLVTIARTTAYHCDEQHDYMKGAGGTDWYPHKWVVEAMRAAVRIRNTQAEDAVREELHKAQAQLSEAQALLREIHDGALSGFARYSKIEEFLSASAEPSAPVERDDETLIDALRTCEKWFIKHSPTAPLIGGFGDAEHPMLTCIRAALERKPQVKS